MRGLICDVTSSLTVFDVVIQSNGNLTDKKEKGGNKRQFTWSGQLTMTKGAQT